jgi:hypothetical protein
MSTQSDKSVTIIISWSHLNANISPIDCWFAIYTMRRQNSIHCYIFYSKITLQREHTSEVRRQSTARLTTLQPNYYFTPVSATEFWSLTASRLIFAQCLSSLTGYYSICSVEKEEEAKKKNKRTTFNFTVFTSHYFTI